MNANGNLKEAEERVMKAIESIEADWKKKYKDPLKINSLEWKRFGPDRKWMLVYCGQPLVRCPLNTRIEQVQMLIDIAKGVKNEHSGN